MDNMKRRVKNITKRLKGKMVIGKEKDMKR